MKFYPYVYFVCVMAAIALMSAAYLLAGYWLILPVFLALALFWILQKKRSIFWPASSFLLVYVLLAVIGIVNRLPMFLLVAGCTAALASWDLTLFQQRLNSTQPYANERNLAKHHLWSLAMAACLGLLLSFIASSIHVRLPFLVVALLALTAMGLLTYGLQSIVKKSS